MATTNLNYDVADNHGHVPVMRERMAELLRPGVEAAGSQAVLVDATLGAGGHSEYFLQTFPQARVIGVDRDEQALQNASARLEPFSPRFCAVNARFDELGTAIAQGEGDIFDAARAHGIAGALFDLGVSSMQLDQAERGFAYKTDAPLDMRMDPSHGLTAADVLNSYSHGTWRGFSRPMVTSVSRARLPPPCSRSARRNRLAPRAGWSSCFTRPFRRQRAARVGTRQSVRSRRCG